MTTSVYDAFLIAEPAHRGQTRKFLDDPYIVHPMRVAQMAAEAGLGPDAEAAGLLHDVPEDTPVTLEDLRTNPRISIPTFQTVKLLTKWWTEKSDPALIAEYKIDYYRFIADNEDALLLKLYDRTDNLSDLTRVIAEAGAMRHRIKWARTYVTKTEAEFDALMMKASRTKAGMAASVKLLAMMTVVNERLDKRV